MLTQRSDVAKKGKASRYEVWVALVALASIWLATSIVGYEHLLETARESQNLDPSRSLPSQIEEVAESAFLASICTLFAAPFVLMFAVKIIRERSIVWLLAFLAIASVPFAIVNELTVNLRIHIYIFTELFPWEAIMWTLAGVGCSVGAYFVWHAYYLFSLARLKASLRIISTSALWLILNIFGEVCFRSLPKHDLYEYRTITGTIFESTPFSHTSYPAVTAHGGGDYAALLVANAYQCAVFMLPLVIFAIPKWRENANSRFPLKLPRFGRQRSRAPE